MSKLKELVTRMGEMEFGEEEDSDLAERSKAALEEQAELESEASEAKSEAEEAEERAAEVEAELSEAEARAEAAEAKAEEAEQDAQQVESELTRLMKQVSDELAETRKQLRSLDEWREGVTERYGLVPSSDDEASDRAGTPADEPLVPEEAFEAARQDAQGKPVQLFRRIMDGFRKQYGDLYDRPGASERVTDRTLNHIRTLQAQRGPEDRPRFV